MKTVTLIFFAIGLITLNSCNQKTDTKAMLENSEMRTEIFDDIANNHNYMTELMDNVQGNEHAMLMMQGNHKMMGNMMQGQGMQMMMNDSMMMGKMMGDKGMDLKEMNKMEN